MENETELLDSQNEETTEEVVSESDTQSEQDEPSNDEVAILKQQNRELFARAKRAEGFTLQNGEWVKTKPKPKPIVHEQEEAPAALSPKDYLALTENKVSSDDFDEVMRLSKILGKSVSETLKDKTAKVIIGQRLEERASAQAANTTSNRRTKSTDENLLENLNKGIVSDKDEDVDKLVRTQLAAKRKAAGLN